jgi:hypothetical protein
MAQAAAAPVQKRRLVKRIVSSRFIGRLLAVFLVVKPGRRRGSASRNPRLPTKLT